MRTCRGGATRRQRDEPPMRLDPPQPRLKQDFSGTEAVCLRNVSRPWRATLDPRSECPQVQRRRRCKNFYPRGGSCPLSQGPRVTEKLLDSEATSPVATPDS